MTDRIDMQTLMSDAAQACGCELVGFERTVHQGKTTFQVFIDTPWQPGADEAAVPSASAKPTPRGVSLDDCALVNRQIRAAMQVAGIDGDQVALEVSSPGLERPLYTLAHYQRFVGHKIKCRLKKAVEGERRNFTGVLQAAAADEISIADGDDVMTLPLAAIARANLVAEW